MSLALPRIRDKAEYKAMPRIWVALFPGPNFEQPCIRSSRKAAFDQIRCCNSHTPPCAELYSGAEISGRWALSIQESLMKVFDINRCVLYAWGFRLPAKQSRCHEYEQLLGWENLTIWFLVWSVGFSEWIELPTSMSHGRDADGQCDPSANLTSSTVPFKTPV